MSSLKIVWIVSGTPGRARLAPSLGPFPPACAGLRGIARLYHPSMRRPLRHGIPRKEEWVSSIRTMAVTEVLAPITTQMHTRSFID